MGGYVVDKKNLKTPDATHKVEDIVFDLPSVILKSVSNQVEQKTS